MNINLATIIIINFRVLAIKIPKIDFISAFWFLILYFGKTISPVRKRLISFPVRRRIAACRRPARGSSGCYFRSLFFSSLSLSLACLSWAPSSFLDFSLYPLSRLRIYSRPLLQFVFISVACNSSLSAFERFLSFFLSLSLSLSLFSAGEETSCCVWDFCRRVFFFWDCGFWRSTGDSWKVFFCVERSVPAKKGVLGLCLERRF
jgi:hypothetical protein